MLLSSNGWPARTPSTRQRKPARPKPDNPRKTVKPTPREKYGLPPRKEAPPLQLGEIEPASSSSSSSSRTSYVEFYQQLVAGTWPGLPSNQQRQRPRLFATDVGTQSAAPSSAGALGVCRKVQPTLRTTQRWTRLQRKVLPMYLLALDDQTSVLLLKCLARLQPPLVPAAAAAAAQDLVTSSSSGLAGEVLTTPTHQQKQQQCAQPTAAAVPTSINGAIRHRLSTAAMGAAAASDAPGDSLSGAAAADVAAVARGFASAADERAQFDLMLAGVCAALQQKLGAWGDRRLVEALCWLAQLQTHHEAFLQAWFAATEPHLQQLPMTYLVSSCEALASLAAPVPSSWLQTFTAATEARLGQLSLQQLAVLLMHVGDLQLQLPDSWWQEFSACVLRHAARKLASAKLGIQLHRTDAADQVQQGAEQQQQLQKPQAARIRAAADALCSTLWANSRLPGQPLQQQFLQQCLALLLPVVEARHCSHGAAAQLLHACCAGACRSLPVAGSAVQACLTRLQERLQKVCADVNTLQLLLACMQLRSVQQQLPPGFCAELEVALLLNLPSLPSQLLVEVGAVFGAAAHSPGLEFMSSFAIVTRQKLGSMAAAEIVLLVDSCLQMHSIMPNLWVVAVLQQLQRYVALRRSLLGSRRRDDTAMTALRLDAAVDVDEGLAGLSAVSVRAVLQQLQQVAADWPSACAGSQGAVALLQDHVRAGV